MSFYVKMNCDAVVSELLPGAEDKYVIVKDVDFFLDVEAKQLHCSVEISCRDAAGVGPHTHKVSFMIPITDLRTEVEYHD